MLLLKKHRQNNTGVDAIARHLAAFARLAQHLNNIEGLAVVVLVDLAPKLLDVLNDVRRNQGTESFFVLQTVFGDEPLMTHAFALELAVTQTAAHLPRRKMQALGGLGD